MMHLRRIDQEQQEIKSMAVKEEEEEGQGCPSPPTTDHWINTSAADELVAVKQEDEEELLVEDYYCYDYYQCDPPLPTTQQQQEQQPASGVVVQLPFSSPPAAPHDFNTTTGAGDAYDHHQFGLLPSEIGDADQLKLLGGYCSLLPLQPDHDEYTTIYGNDYCYGDSNMINSIISNVESSSSSSSYHYFNFTTTTTTTNCNDGDGDEVDAGFWNELGPLLPSPAAATLPHAAVQIPTEEDKTKAAAGITSGGNAANALTRESVSRYFYMPITQAARELKVGLTLLKKRCRELGVRRWPHRKLMSLQTLISNIRRLQGNGGGDDDRLKEAIRVLEMERQLLEECPDLQLQRNTKRLRQACFKANYKSKKKHFSADSNLPSSSPNRSSRGRQRRRVSYHDTAAATTSLAEEEEEEDDDDDEIKSLLHLPLLDHHDIIAPDFGF